ncbi:unnamed protein product [Heterotrigona itama]|uniref:Uncharacterized protein n=1 Tax=Heterotrigona itama TaxID=395501 RepID=A0A6V7GZY6_9HYME|nr:unnamed protein product [Heterotrigona itama]
MRECYTPYIYAKRIELVSMKEQRSSILSSFEFGFHVTVGIAMIPIWCLSLSTVHSLFGRICRFNSAVPPFEERSINEILTSPHPSSPTENENLNDEQQRLSGHASLTAVHGFFQGVFLDCARRTIYRSTEK